MSDKKEHIEQAELFKAMLLGKFSTEEVIESLSYLRDFRNELLDKEIEATRSKLSKLRDMIFDNKPPVIGDLKDESVRVRLKEGYKKKGGGSV
jgi:hypothetical protein